jgi:hypothetical protein
VRGSVHVHRKRQTKRMVDIFLAHAAGVSSAAR